MNLATMTPGRAILNAHSLEMVHVLARPHGQGGFGVRRDDAVLRVGQWWDRLVKRLMLDGCDQATAEEYLDAAFLFLAGRGDRYPATHHHPDSLTVPDLKADKGWHVILQYTPEFAAFGIAVTGRRLEHSPRDTEGLAGPHNGDPCDCC